MTEFQIHTPATAPALSRDRLEAVGKAWGFVPKLHALLAESPLALEAYDTLFALVAAKSTFTPGELQVAYLAVSAQNECTYCVAGHTYLARAAELPEAAIQALRAQTPIGDARLEALRRFAVDIVAKRGFAGDAAVDAFLAAGFSRAQVLELVAIVATKTISNYANHLTHTPAESFMADPAFGWTAPRNRKSA